MNEFNWKTICFLAVAFCCGCRDEELAIEFIRSAHPAKSYDRGASGDCIMFQYYTIANYRQIPSDSLYKVLNEHIFSIYPYEKYVENISRNPYCYFYIYFYEKSLLVDYEKYISDAVYYNEKGFIDEYSHKLVAKIYSFRNDDKALFGFGTVLYDMDRHPIFPNAMFGDVKIKLEKEDTIRVQPE